MGSHRGGTQLQTARAVTYRYLPGLVTCNINRRAPTSSSSSSSSSTLHFDQLLLPLHETSLSSLFFSSSLSSLLFSQTNAAELKISTAVQDSNAASQPHRSIHFGRNRASAAHLHRRQPYGGHPASIIQHPAPTSPSFCSLRRRRPCLTSSEQASPPLSRLVTAASPISGVFCQQTISSPSLLGGQARRLCSSDHFLVIQRHRDVQLEPQ